jgi:hypothetical protein
MVLRDDPDKPRFIETVVGKGYRFAAPVAVNGEATESATAGLPALSQPAQVAQSAATAAAPAQRMHRRPPVVIDINENGRAPKPVRDLFACNQFSASLYQQEEQLHGLPFEAQNALAPLQPIPRLVKC